MGLFPGLYDDSFLRYSRKTGRLSTFLSLDTLHKLQKAPVEGSRLSRSLLSIKIIIFHQPSYFKSVSLVPSQLLGIVNLSTVNVFLGAERAGVATRGP